MSLDVSTVARWSEVAAQCLQQIDPAQKYHLLQRADEILHEVGAETFAYLSNTSPLGFERRLAAFGKRLLEALKAKGAETLEPLAEARRSILEHDRAKVIQEHRRLERIDMAIRLMRWLIKQGTDEPARLRSLALAIADYLAEGGFVDWALPLPVNLNSLVLWINEPTQLKTAVQVLVHFVLQWREIIATRTQLNHKIWTNWGGTSLVLPPKAHKERSSFTQAASGERLPPYGRLNSVEESKTIPNFVWRFHIVRTQVKSAFRLPVFLLVGGITINFPSALRSNLMSGFAI